MNYFFFLALLLFLLPLVVAVEIGSAGARGGGVDEREDVATGGRGGGTGGWGVWEVSSGERKRRWNCNEIMGIEWTM